MFAVLHLADFALRAVLRTESGPADRPAALFSGHARKSLLVQATPAARAAGVEPGMTAPQAVARCPGLVIRTPQPAAEADARAALLAVAFTLSPAIEDTGPGICTVDLKGCEGLLEPAATVAVAQLNELGLPATAGLARTPLLALYAARAAGGSRLPPEAAAGPEPMTDFLLAEAPDDDRPPLAAAGPPVLTVTDEARFLSPLPLATADPPPEIAAVLASWGLRTCGDLTALPRDAWVRRFGAAGLEVWTRATGGAPRPLHLVAPVRTFTAMMEFDPEIESLEPLLFMLRRFLDRLTLELRAAQLVAAEAGLTLQLEDDTRHERHFRLPEPTADAGILFRTLHTHLESLRTDAAIRAIALDLTPARPLVRQQGLFETGLRDPHGFAETLARVAALVGSDRVGTPRPEDTHRPDAVRIAAPAAVVPPPAGAPVHAPCGLPLRRFRPPLRATLEFTSAARQPTYLATEQFQGEISGIRGPWRSSGDWWQADRAWARTEWDIALAGGGLYRLVRLGEAWFIEGEYD